ncbi:MAG TPA: peptidoglycan-associated lipoprotein Pal [Candidatus Sumerlaeota bacterium]|nr:peptidoglycan-associated lipoprotein Pal [Candidatus Sumerlaeota bacterium]
MLNVGKRWMLKLVLFVLVVDLFCVGCAKIPLIGKLFAKKKEQSSPIYPSDPTLPPAPDPDSMSGSYPKPLPMDHESGTPTAPPLRMEATKQIAELQTVYFDFDSAELSESARAVLDQNAIWLSENPGVHVLIEGHCDERGTVEYNLNLGERRAASVREYLIGKNLDAATLHTISYGEERPIDEGHDETAWSQNRRVQFMAY